MTLNFDAGGTSFGLRGTTGSVSAGRPDRGGRLKGAVAAGVRLGSEPGAGVGVSASAGRTLRTAPPTRTVAGPVSSSPSASMRRPSTMVPFVEPLSRIRTPSPSSDRVQWLQEALSVWSATSACGERPTTSSRWSRTGTMPPTASPPESETLHPATRASTRPGFAETSDPSRRTRSRSSVVAVTATPSTKSRSPSSRRCPPVALTSSATVAVGAHRPSSTASRRPSISITTRTAASLGRVAPSARTVRGTRPETPRRRCRRRPGAVPGPVHWPRAV